MLMVQRSIKTPATIIFSIAVLFVLLSTGAGKAQPSVDTQNDAFDAATSFAKCAAMYDVLREVAKIAEDPTLAQSYNDLSNGAETTALYFARGGELKEPKVFVTETYNMYFNRYLSGYKYKDMSEIKTQMQVCETINPVQGKVVDQIRRSLYGIEAK